MSTLYLQTLTPELTNKILEISPFNAMAYGALVFMLGFIAYVFFSLYKDEKKYNRTKDGKILEILPLIAKQLERQTDMPSEINVITSELKSVVEDIKKNNQRLDDKLVDLHNLIVQRLK